MNALRFLLAPFALTVIANVAFAADIPPRRVLTLDGTWQIAEGKMDAAPAVFAHTVPVPGLTTLATPAFDPMPGPTSPDRQHPILVDPAREAFWYRRTFRVDGPLPAVARLKVHKAMFGTRVFLNGQLLGDHAPNVTPGWFDARAALRPGDNEVLIRVGAARGAVPKGVPALYDVEKERYIPGIFDSMELILSGTPHFLHVQTAPDIVNRSVRVQVTLGNAGPALKSDVTFVVREAKSGRIVGRETRPAVACAAGSETVVHVIVPIADCRRWSPEDPFLYRLDADSGADRFTTRFGMREFKFDPATGRAVLNGKPYFMRGTNFTLYRFFEDPECGDLPWRADWVRLLHQRAKDMNWNCVRYCIGFPPERWYEIADELGILVQDEFPIWGLDGSERDELAREYAEWMRERWNHPSVVIWDAQNETRGTLTGEALNLVRALDLSNRPWDNGWGPAQLPTDSYESHPYHFIRAGAILADRAHTKPEPHAPIDNDDKHAAIINEYGWLWLNRDGTPTTLTADLYRNLLGADATVAQRRHLYATYLAAETEFWRSHRTAAAVMHFTTLGYSRPDGQTSDHWTDVARLTWEPGFLRYVRDAFAPVGLMVDFWHGTGIRGSAVRVPVRLVNDLEKPWSGPVTLRLLRANGGAPVFEQTRDVQLESYGTGALEFSFSWPEQTGACVLEAVLTGAEATPVRSVREITIIDVSSLGLAVGKPVTASSAKPGNPPAAAVDGDLSTFWASDAVDPSWLALDLGSVRRVSRVSIAWGRDYSAAFSIEISTDGLAWKQVHAARNPQAASVSDISLPSVAARHVRVTGTDRRVMTPSGKPSTNDSHAIRELQVFE